MIKCAGVLRIYVNFIILILKISDMAVNKLALLRYNTIDKCLQNRRRKWTLEDLIDKVSEVLYEHEGIATGVSKRTIQSDIQTMRSDQLGYNAPIIVIDRKYYTYAAADYSIHQVPISDQDVTQLKSAIGIIRQLSGFAHLEEMNDIVLRLEHSLNTHQKQQKSVVHLEQNELVKGLHWIPQLMHYIQQEIPILLSYQSFKAAAPSETIFYPYLLKEYRKRWFLVGKCKGIAALQTRALDRILDIEEMAKKNFVAYDGIDFNIYYGECIGVTRSEEQRPMKVIFKVAQQHAQYVLTKPLHHSQQVLMADDNATTFRIDVIPNFELEKELLSYGEVLQVQAPKTLRQRLEKRIARMHQHYS